MPALSGQHDDLILKWVVFPAQTRERLLEYLVLLVLAQLVLLAKLSGKRCARTGSLVRNSSAASSAFPMRPAALMRGAST